MGKQASRDLRSKAEQLFKLFPNKFSTDFEANKKALAGLRVPFPKMSLNIIAGQLVRICGRKTV